VSKAMLTYKIMCWFIFRLPKIPVYAVILEGVLARSMHFKWHNFG